MNATEGLSLARLEQTGTASPSQWDAWTVDGRYLYIRYRHGYLTVEAASSKQDWWDGTPELLYEAQLSPDELHGHLPTQEMLTATGLVPPSER